MELTLLCRIPMNRSSLRTRPNASIQTGYFVYPILVVQCTGPARAFGDRVRDTCHPQNDIGAVRPGTEFIGFSLKTDIIFSTGRYTSPQNSI